ncbi:MAG: LysR family transcriptional regulator [Luminiphilus sp.]|nr:LysR family transcriptional regulator [Luminiphilus sp.]
MKGLKLQQLRYVLAVLDDGGFKAAAKRLHRTQPALSLGVRELEDGLGAPIFERQGAGGLTPFGEICIPRFRELLGVHDRVLKDLDDVVNQRSGRVEVVTAPSVARRYMPSVLNQFLRRYPSLEIVLHDGPADVVADMVRTGEVEFGVSALWGEADDLEFAPLLADEVGVVCHHTHPLADANSLRWQDLIGQAMIRNGTSRLLETTPAGNLLPDSRIYISEMISIVAMLETGTAYTTLPRLAFQDSVSTLRFIPLKNPTVKREIGIITRRGVTASPAAQIVIEALREAIAAASGS